MEERRAGPVLRGGDVADAVLEAIREDNSDKDIVVDDHGAYVRIEAAGGLILNRGSVEAALGRAFKMQELEMYMSSFSGKIEITQEYAKWFFKS